VKNKEWHSTKNAVYILNYHFVWSTKYRRRIFYSPIDLTLSQIIKDLCIQNGLEIIQLEIMPDHVHLFIFAKPTDSPSHIMCVIRGASAYQLFREFPAIKKKLWGGYLWNPSYYVGTAGQMSSETIKKYIENQKTA